MEPAFAAVVREPPVPPHYQQPYQLGEAAHVHGGGWRRPVRGALALVVFLAVTGSFALAAYRARHATRGVAFVLVAYSLLALLACCAVKLERLRRRRRHAARRWVGIAVCAISAALGNMFASPVADAMPRPAMELVVAGVAAAVLGLGLGFYFHLFGEDDAERSCDGELDRRRPWPR